ncbi:MAG TPA: tetratricopeptide repeat protein [Dongiaceae bacterium]|nr:tetratricopeptide repeat protein [Dongiaceae bacterium]
MPTADLPKPEAISRVPPDKTSQPTLTLDCLIIGDVGEPEAMLPGNTITFDARPAEPKVDLAEVHRLEVLCEQAHVAGDIKRLREHLLAIIDIDRANAQANFNLGVLKRNAGLQPEAEMHFRRAIKTSPENVLYRLALAELLHLMKHLLFAAEAYEAGLAIDPNHVTMLTNLMGVRQRMRMPHEVADLSRRLLVLDPQSLPATFSLAWALLWLGETEEAADTAERAALIDPQSLQVKAMQHIAAKRLGRTEAATAILAEIERRSFALWEDCATAIDTFGQFEETDAIEAILRAIIAARPGFVPALLQLGRYLILKGETDEGFDIMFRVVELDPKEGDAQTSVSLTMVRNGDFANGWARHHWRWKRTGGEEPWDLPMPAWDGSAPLDGRLLIWREQGIGDMIMFVAPAILCRELGITPILETNPRLRTLFKRSFPDMGVICRDDMPEDFFAQHDVVAQCPIGDLPHLLKVDMANYPGRDGFLTPHPKEISQLRDRYRLLFPGKKLVGISWRSGNSGNAMIRSIDLSHWMPIFETEDTAFISLQYGDVSKDIAALREDHGVEVYVDTQVDAMQDMDRFAAQVAAVDVVISVDNSTIHVAGALGKATWALIPAASDWRWLAPARTDTAWYRSVTLLRCLVGEGWEPRIRDAAERLRSLTTETMDAERQAFYERCSVQSFDNGDINTAEEYFRLILSKDISHHLALAGLGRVALRTGHTEDAIGLLRQSTELAPDTADYWRDLALALYVGGRYEKAFEAVRKSLRLDGNDSTALKIAIDIARPLNKADDAANFCARLLRIEPDDRIARLHLAQLQVDAGDFDIAEANFRRVLDKTPDDAIAAYSVGCLALRREDLPQGWRDFARRFDAGLARPQHALELQPLQTVWSKADQLAKARVAVRPEPSLKDQIMLARWLPMLRRDVGFQVAEVDPRLLPLIDQTATRMSLFPSGSLQASDADDLDLTAEIALGDLGMRYGQSIEALGTGLPYLRVDINKVTELRKAYLAALGARSLIGICWRGADMSIALSEWLPVLKLDQFGFVALQAGPAQQELHEVFDSLGRSAIRDPSIDPQTNLRSYAAQIAAVDLVISIDEVPAHLAGALGVPTFCLLPEVADWRWFGAERTDSPWYPSMRLYRQKADAGWSDIMTAVAEDLQARMEMGDRVGNA